MSTSAPAPWDASYGWSETIVAPSGAGLALRWGSSSQPANSHVGRIYTSGSTPTSVRGTAAVRMEGSNVGHAGFWLALPDSIGNAVDGTEHVGLTFRGLLAGIWSQTMTGSSAELRISYMTNAGEVINFASASVPIMTASRYAQFEVALTRDLRNYHQGSFLNGVYDPNRHFGWSRSLVHARWNTGSTPTTTPGGAGWTGWTTLVDVDQALFSLGDTILAYRHYGIGLFNNNSVAGARTTYFDNIGFKEMTAGESW